MDGKCLTLNGNQCKFPFIFKGILRNVCLPFEFGGSWCSIHTDEHSYHIVGDGNWELCGPYCPVLAITNNTESVEEVNSANKTNCKFD